MYICICNGIRENDVTHAVRKGARSSDAVYRHLGVEPACASCCGDIDELVRRATGDSLRGVALRPASDE